jgi:hypothetical protein
LMQGCGDAAWRIGVAHPSDFTLGRASETLRKRLSTVTLHGNPPQTLQNDPDQ